MSNIEKSSYGITPEGKSIELYTLKNAKGVSVGIINYGASVVSFVVPDKNGNYDDVALGYDNLQGYLDGQKFMGATVGRFANRIANSKFTLDDVEYQLPINDGKNHLHGGVKGFDKKVWDARISEEKLIMCCSSEDGEEGYPGEVDCTLVYTLDGNNKLMIDCSAVSTKATPLSITHHGYFNLDGSETILDHELLLNADSYTPLNNGVPDGTIEKVLDTPFDFSQSKKIGADINSDHAQIKAGIGYDHNFAVIGGGKSEAVLAATVTERSSGRRLRVYTNAPGIQFYSGNHMEGSDSGKGVPLSYRRGLCLEPQHFPDAPNQEKFPNSILRPGETYQHTMIYQLDLV